MDFDLAITSVQDLALGIAGIVFIVAGIALAATRGNRGDMKGSAKGLGALAMCCVPIVIGAGMLISNVGGGLLSLFGITTT